MGSEQNRLSAFFGGGDKTRKASLWSQTSNTTTELSTSPAGRYSHYEPPIITVSDQGVEESGMYLVEMVAFIQVCASFRVHSVAVS